MPLLRVNVIAIAAGLCCFLAAPPVAAQDDQPGTSIELVRDYRGDNHVPYGVDVGLWQQLVDELLARVEPQADELGVHAPHGERNRIRDLALFDDGLGKHWVEWCYLNVGDYNLNGVVDVDDLYPVAQHYQARQGDEGWGKLSAADGNQDGVIDLADVAVIAENYGHCVTSYRVVSGWIAPQLPAEATRVASWTWVLATVPVRPSSMYDAQVPRLFSVEIDLARAGDELWIEPLAEVRGAVSEPHAPVGLAARLKADPRGGAVPLTVKFDKSRSKGEGKKLEPEWDFDGDGIFSEPGDETRGPDGGRVPKIEFSEPNSRLVQVRISAADGRQDIARAPLLLYRAMAWRHLDPQLADNRRVALIAGRPAVAYPVELAAGGWQLRCVVAEDEDATAWPEPRVVAELPVAPAKYELREIAGRPALAYTLTGADGAASTYFASAGDAKGAKWNPPVLAVDGLGPNDLTPLLGEAAGYPALVYMRRLPGGDPDQPGYELMFMRAADEHGLLWSEPVVIGTLEPRQFRNCNPRLRTFTAIGGRAAVFFSAGVMEGTGHMLVRADDAAGDAWGGIERFGTTYAGSNQGHDRPASGLVDVNCAPACLHSRTWDHFSKAKYSLDVLGAERGQSIALANLPFDYECRFFSGVTDSTGDYSEAVYLGQAADGIAALVSQHRRGGGPVRLRAAISTAGEVWRPTPEFVLDDFVAVLAVELTHRADPESGAEHSWLTLCLAGPTGDGPGLWLTHLPLAE